MKKQEPFYYEARLPEVDAEIAIEFFPDCNMMNIHFIKDGKKHILSMMNMMRAKLQKSNFYIFKR